MAKKLLNPLEDPPTASSSSDDDEVETSSEEEQQPKVPSPKTLKTPSTAAPSSGSDSEAEETEPEETIAVTPSKKKKETADSTALALVKSRKKKRPSEATTSEHAKRAKKVSEDNKKSPFQRLWSQEDEISLLQGFIDFQADKGTNPYDDMNGFFDVCKECISFDVSKTQFIEKIRSLRYKYHMGKNKKVKDSSSFTKPHDKKCFGLANCIWRSDDGMAVKSPVISNKVDKKMKKKLGMALESAAAVVKGNGSSKDEEVVILGGVSESSNLFDKSFMVPCIVSLGVDEYSVKEKWSKVPMETKKRIEDKLKLVEDKEVNLLVLKTDIVKEVASVIKGI